MKLKYKYYTYSNTEKCTNSWILFKYTRKYYVPIPWYEHIENNFDLYFKNWKRINYVRF